MRYLPAFCTILESFLDTPLLQVLSGLQTDYILLMRIAVDD
jgi:hypothetical protein